MTDRTHPDSGRIITSGDLLLHDAKTALMYEELRAAIDDGHESMTHADALAEIAAIRAENARLCAQLEAIGAGGVSGPLMGRTDSKERAGRFTKKPVTIEAIQWTGKNLREVIAFTDGPPDTRSMHAGMAWEAYTDLVAREGLKIYTLEGKMLANPGDWIIRGVKGEYYPCKPDIFAATYERASIAASAGSEPVAWLVCTEEGDPSMVFLDQREAQMFLDDDERPTPLYTHPSPTSAEGVEHG